MKKDGTLFRLKTGVVLKLSPVGALILWEVARRIKAPKPPRVFIEAKGREEENPDDPAYREAVTEYNVQMATAVQDAYLMFGSTLKTVPASVPKPDDVAWTEELGYLGIPVPTSSKPRYALWVRLVASGGDPVEMARLTQAMGDQVTVSEEAVAEAAESFPGDEGRGDAVGPPPKARRTHRNRV